MNIVRCLLAVAFLCTAAGMWPSNGEAAAYPCRIPQGHGGESNLMPVIGFVDSHILAEGQTLLDIARKYGLGYNQMVLVHPDMAYQKAEDCCEDSEKSAEEAKAAASRAEAAAEKSERIFDKISGK